MQNMALKDKQIIFEQPLNEHIRVCLRLEHLFNQALDNMNESGEWQTRAAITAMLEAVNVIDRPDLKTKLVKALGQHAEALALWEQKPNVDHEKLHKILSELDQLIDSLYQNQDKLVQNLRNNSFLNLIRMHMANPGGANPFSTPAFYLWLHKPEAERQQELAQWFKEFEQLRTAINLLLHLTRNSAAPKHILAEQGFYQQALDANSNYNLIRIIVPLELQVYPEISVGRHRLSVRFFGLNTNDRPSQIAQDVPFDLACCAS